MVLYHEIFEDNLLNMFGDKKQKIGQISLENAPNRFIDIKRICEIMEIEVREPNNADEFDYSDSGMYKSESNTILYNPYEPENRKRFTIAHELGHALFKHMGESYRTQLVAKYIDVIQRMNEQVANKFAAQLLMPNKLVKILIKDVIQKLKLNKDNLKSDELAIIISEVSKELKVSEIALRYSIENNGILQEAKKDGNI